MRKNKLKQMFNEGKPIINGWLQIPSAFSAEVMAHQGWDSCTIDMQHGVIDYPNALKMLQALSTTDVTPCLLYTSPSPRDLSTSRMPSSA